MKISTHAEARNSLITTLGKVFCTFINVLLFFIASLNGQEFTRNLLWESGVGLVVDMSNLKYMH